MMNTRPWQRREQAGGSAAVEMAILLPFLVLLLASALFFARIFMFYSIGQKAAHDAARFLSTVSQAEMRTPGSGFNEARVAALARWIAQEELLEIVDLTDGVLITILCDDMTCGIGVPNAVRVSVQMALHDNLLGSLTSTYLGNTDIVMVGNVTLRYVGR
jgi:Flp pilus assembly protein TadG